MANYRRSPSPSTSNKQSPRTSTPPDRSFVDVVVNPGYVSHPRSPVRVPKKPTQRSFKPWVAPRTKNKPTWWIPAISTETSILGVRNLLRITKQSGRSPKVVAVFLLQTLVTKFYDFFKCMIQSKWNHVLLPNLVAFISQNEKNVWVFNYNLLTCSAQKMVLICLMQNIDMCLLYKSHQIARLVSHLINQFSKWMFTV